MEKPTLEKHAASIVAGIRLPLAEQTGDPDPDALPREVLRQLDLALHPWGEPGQVPTEPGAYELRTKSRAGKRLVMACWLSGDLWGTEPWPAGTVLHRYSAHKMSDDAQRYGYEFRPRRRWTEGAGDAMSCALSASSSVSELLDALVDDLHALRWATFLIRRANRLPWYGAVDEWTREQCEAAIRAALTDLERWTPPQSPMWCHDTTAALGHQVAREGRLWIQRVLSDVLAASRGEQ
jgi:hypothetical protein